MFRSTSNRYLHTNLTQPEFLMAQLWRTSMLLRGLTVLSSAAPLVSPRASQGFPSRSIICNFRHPRGRLQRMVRWQSYHLEQLLDAEDRFHELERHFDNLNGSLISHHGVKSMLTIFMVNVGCLNISSRNESHEMVDDVV